jgi:acyl-coenzyme A thioesterase PaaI-like protein
MAVADDALFVTSAAHVTPTDLARGPWSPDALHGGPVGALVARAVEGVVPDEPMVVTRLTIELLRPVPVAPLTVSATVSRPGRKVQLVDVRIESDGRDVVWGRALRVRTLAGPEAAALPDPQAQGPVPGAGDGAPPGPHEGHAFPPPLDRYRAFHNAGAEMRYVAGEFDGRGPASVWTRLTVPVVSGEEPTSLQRVAAAGDFGNGVSSELDFTRYVFINPDLTIYLHRPAVGEWVCLDAATRLGVPGTGVAQSLLYDVRGPVGRALQGLVVEPRA